MADIDVFVGKESGSQTRQDYLYAAGQTPPAHHFIIDIIFHPTAGVNPDVWEAFLSSKFHLRH
jgi:hypothetical protein